MPQRTSNQIQKHKQTFTIETASKKRNNHITPAVNLSLYVLALLRTTRLSAETTRETTSTTGWWERTQTPLPPPSGPAATVKDGGGEGIKKNKANVPPITEKRNI